MYKVSIVIAVCFVFAIVLTVAGQQAPAGQTPAGQPPAGQQPPRGQPPAAQTPATGQPPAAAAQLPAVDLDATMKAVQPVWGGLPARVTASDASGVAADAVKLEGLFTDAQRFFQREKMQQAADWSRDAADLAGAAAKTGRAGKVDNTTKNGININCKQCHDVYRVKGDAGFVLKRQ